MASIILFYLNQRKNLNLTKIRLRRLLSKSKEREGLGEERMKKMKNKKTNKCRRKHKRLNQLINKNLLKSQKKK